MRDPWVRRIDRAAHLADRDEAARPLLTAYGRLLGLQRDCSATIGRAAARLSGNLESDLSVVRACVAPILTATIENGPPRLAQEAREIRERPPSAIDAMLLDGWRTPSRPHFFAKVILQPYAEHLAAAALRPGDRTPGAGQACPFCGGPAQLSILRSAANEDGGGRHLECATCFTAWPVRRVLCPHCGEDDERRLCYYHSPAFDHLRVDACETCRHYLKTVDLTRSGLAVPLVDEVAGAPLDLWAAEQGYQKIELNLVGL
jgi:formate dehydrogenase maturation protein FdhE